MPKLTEALVEGLAIDGRDRTVFDTLEPGFGLRVTPAGKRIFIARARAGGQAHKVTIGSYPEKSVADARREARQALDDLRGGEIPASSAKPASRPLRHLG
jgi:hypothetical protein